MSLHLTEIQLSYEGAVKAGLRDAYAWHRKVWLCFPDRPDAARDFLTRLDPRDDHFRLLLLSAVAPQRPPWCPTGAWRSKAVPDDFLTAATAFRFSVVANPTQKLVVRDAAGTRKKNGRRVPVIHRDDVPDAAGKPQPGLLSWLTRKGEAHGFTFLPDEVRTVPRPRQYFIKGGTLGLHAGVEFQGRLRVTDPARFAEAFARGIGSAKAFGFGMLVLSPL